MRRVDYLFLAMIAFAAAVASAPPLPRLPVFDAPTDNWAGTGGDRVALATEIANAAAIP